MNQGCVDTLQITRVFRNFLFEGARGSVLGKLELSVKVYSELTVLLCVRCPEGALFLASLLF